MTVRLEWDGKPQQVERPHLPLQTVETMNGSRATHRNLLAWGDNKLVMGSLLEELAGGIDLIYVDPPFATGADFKIARQEIAYRDTWSRGTDSYLSMIYERIVLMHELLAADGSFYIHLDSHMAHYVKVLCDEVFGRENFMRQIIWRIGWISGYKAKAANWARNHDTILFYVKDRENFTFNKIYVEHDPNYRRRSYGSDEMGEVGVVDEDGAETPDGKPIDDVWTNLPSIQIMSFSGEKTGYPTQKNLDLLERIIRSSSNEGDLVADFFCGAGTTLVAAERLGRRWIGSDLGRFAIHTTRKRLLSTPDCAPFDIKDLGGYERQRWQGDYRAEMLALYEAQPLDGFLRVHGRKDGRVVHVGATDAPVTVDECEELMDELADHGLAACDVLGWEWELGLHDTIAERARRRGLDLRARQIPRDVLERVEADVRFFELNFVDFDIRRRGREVVVALKGFAIRSEELIPPKVRDSIADWSDLVDYWSVDFDYRDGTFNSQWQAYRTKAEPALAVATEPHTYEAPGRYAVVVKLIDILGNDTTKLAEVTVT